MRTVVESSPFYPSLLSVYRSLQYFGLNCNVVRIDMPGLLSLHRPVLLHIKEDESEEIILAKEIDKDRITYYDSSKQHFYRTSSKEFIGKWDGIAIYASQQKYRTKWGREWLLLPVLLIMTILSFQNLAYLLFTLNSLGLYVSSVLLLHEKGISSILVNNVCKINKNFDCDAVVKSQSAKIGLISLAELSCIYFSSILLLIFAAHAILLLPHSDTIEYLSFLNLLCCPFLLYSIISQWHLKKWCFLCLSISLIIGSETLLLFCFYHRRSIPLQILELHSFFIFLVGICLFAIQKYLSQKEIYQNLQTEMLKIKRKPNIFSLLIEQSPSILIQDNSYLIIGKKDAPITITTWISPFCAHCGKLITDMISMYKIHQDKFQWHIYLKGKKPTERVENEVQLFLVSLYLKDAQHFSDTLKYWYRNPRKSFLKACTATITNEAMLLFEEQVAFTEEMNIKEYPSVFMNGVQLPKEYSLTDLPYILYDKEIIETLSKKRAAI